jgi:hypothetical protein
VADVYVVRLLFGGWRVGNKTGGSSSIFCGFLFVRKKHLTLLRWGGIIRESFRKIQQ